MAQQPLRQGIAFTLSWPNSPTYKAQIIHLHIAVGHESGSAQSQPILLATLWIRVCAFTAYKTKSKFKQKKSTIVKYVCTKVHQDGRIAKSWR
jgi:hypothetical protein